MRSPDWQRVFAIFEQALEKPAEELASFLDEVCTDPVLRRGVEELLAAHHEDTPVFARPFVEQSAGDAREPDTSVAGDDSAELPWSTVGPYRLLRRLGQGGMSTVYLAQRDDDTFRRQVVVKVVRTDMQTAALLRRLRVERQILAKLEHANIARLYDGGSAHDLPYFVMEYVDGLPIDVYCDHHRLDLRARLRLFTKVCAAVDYAHRNLIVHRDIKPSNILVTADGEPKLLDFGIAKLLDPEIASSDFEPTANWQRWMTPGLASPEQIRGETITTVSDVYSLGVLLYLLLTHRLPHRFENRSLREIERVLAETEPQPPSVAAAEAPRSQDGAPSEPPTRLAPRELAGDIDAIIMKALRSSPARRYASVDRFTSDLERFLQGLPVEARRGTWRYRAGKFLRRHRKAAVAAGAAAAALAAFTIATALQARRIATERDKKARVVALILEVFTLGNPYVKPGRELTVREALEHSLPLIESGLADQPDVRAELLHTTGSILSGLGRYEPAARQLEEALALRTRLHGENSHETASSMVALAGVHRQRLELDRAEQLARRALEIERSRVGKGHPDLIRPLLELISVHCYQEQYGPVPPLADEVLALTSELSSEARGRIAATEYLAQARGARGEYAEAIALNQQALELYRRHYGAEYPAQITTLNNLGVQLRQLDRLEEARAAYAQALELQRKTYGDAHVDPALLNNLASSLFAIGGYAEAERLFREALRVVEERYDGAPWMRLSLGLHIARTRSHQGAPAEAEREVRRLIELELVEADHWLAADARSVLGESLSLQGRCDEAEPLLAGGFRDILARNQRARVQRGAFERLREHLLRCGKPTEVPAYESLLKTTGES